MSVCLEVSIEMTSLDDVIDANQKLNINKLNEFLGFWFMSFLMCPVCEDPIAKKQEVIKILLELDTITQKYSNEIGAAGISLIHIYTHFIVPSMDSEIRNIIWNSAIVLLCICIYTPGVIPNDLWQQFFEVAMSTTNENISIPIIIIGTPKLKNTNEEIIQQCSDLARHIVPSLSNQSIIIWWNYLADLVFPLFFDKGRKRPPLLKQKISTIFLQAITNTAKESNSLRLFNFSKPNQIKYFSEILRFATEIHDGKTLGMKSAIKFLNVCFPCRFSIHNKTVPEGMKPKEFFKKYVDEFLEEGRDFHDLLSLCEVECEQSAFQTVQDIIEHSDDSLSLFVSLITTSFHLIEPLISIILPSTTINSFSEKLSASNDKINIVEKKIGINEKVLSTAKSHSILLPEDLQEEVPDTKSQTVVYILHQILRTRGILKLVLGTDVGPLIATEIPTMFLTLDLASLWPQMICSFASVLFDTKQINERLKIDAGNVRKQMDICKIPGGSTGLFSLLVVQMIGTLSKVMGFREIEAPLLFARSVVGSAEALTHNSIYFFYGLSSENWSFDEAVTFITKFIMIFDESNDMALSYAAMSALINLDCPTDHPLFTHLSNFIFETAQSAPENCIRNAFISMQILISKLSYNIEDKHLIRYYLLLIRAIDTLPEDEAVDALNAATEAVIEGRRFAFIVTPMLCIIPFARGFIQKDNHLNEDNLFTVLLVAIQSNPKSLDSVASLYSQPQNGKRDFGAVFGGKMALKSVASCMLMKCSSPRFLFARIVADALEDPGTPIDIDLRSLIHYFIDHTDPLFLRLLGFLVNDFHEKSDSHEFNHLILSNCAHIISGNERPDMFEAAAILATDVLIGSDDETLKKNIQIYSNNSNTKNDAVLARECALLIALRGRVIGNAENLESKIETDIDGKGGIVVKIPAAGTVEEFHLVSKEEGAEMDTSIWSRGRGLIDLLCRQSGSVLPLPGRPTYRAAFVYDPNNNEACNFLAAFNGGSPSKGEVRRVFHRCDVVLEINSSDLSGAVVSFGALEISNASLGIQIEPVRGGLHRVTVTGFDKGPLAGTMLISARTLPTLVMLTIIAAYISDAI